MDEPRPQQDQPLPVRVELPRSIWRAHEAAHHAKVAPLTTDWLRRSSRGVAHPVWDFLFTYYRFKPGRLLTWVPGMLGVATPAALSAESHDENTVVWEAPALPGRVRELARWVARLCAAMLERPPGFHCYGLHEWAMVYGQTADELRHHGWALRLGSDTINRFVESRNLVCTHYDALRFFTPAARPRNQFSPTSESRAEWEQTGCLHANMDLYKWAYKLWPWIGSDLVADAFALAARGRALDMRSSPYDLQSLGFEPICLETEAGREQFRQAQQELTKAAAPIRRRLLAAAQSLSGS